MAAVQHIVGLVGEGGANGLDETILAEEIGVFIDPIPVVTGDDGAAIANEQGGHGDTSFWMQTGWDERKKSTQRMLIVGSKAIP